MKTKIFEDAVYGTHLKFIDMETSITVPYVFNELNTDRYGLEKINLEKNDTIIDIGANVGMFSIYAKKKFGCRVISFEPVPFNFENFKKNIVLNGLSLNDFEIYNLGISDTQETVNIGTPIYNSGGSSVFRTENISSKCKMDTLEKYVDDTCKYLKMDCEGGEYFIIPNIINYINTFKYIGIEYHEFPNTKYPQDHLRKLLAKNFTGKIF